MDRWMDGWIDESPGILPVFFSSVCFLLKYSANYGILTLDKRSRGDKVFWQEVQKAINRKAAKIGILGVHQGYPDSCQCSIAASNLNSGNSLEKISYI